MKKTTLIYYTENHIAHNGGHNTNILHLSQQNGKLSSKNRSVHTHICVVHTRLPALSWPTSDYDSLQYMELTSYSDHHKKQLLFNY